MKSLKLMAAPAVKLQIGKNNSVTIDTSSNASGHKTFNVSVTTDDDSISNTVDEVISEVKDEIENNQPQTHIEHYREQEVLDKMYERQKEHNDSIMVVVIVVVFFIYKMYNSRQKRIIADTMIKNNMTPPEEKTGFDSFLSFFEKGKIQTFEQKKYLKNTIIALSFGISYIISHVLEYFFNIEIFWGLLALCLGIGFLYMYRTTIENSTSPKDFKDPTIDSSEDTKD